MKGTILTPSSIMLARRMFRLLIVLLLGISSTGWSQKPAPVFYVIEEEVVDPTLMARYETGVKTLVEGLRRAGLDPELGFATSQRGQSFFYLFTIRSLDELNPRSPVTQLRFQKMIQAAGEETAQKFVAMTVPSPVRSVRLSVLESVSEFSYQPAVSAVKEPKFMLQEEHRVRHDMIEPYKAVMKRLIEAMHKAGYPIGWTAYRSVIGEGRGFFGEGRYYYYVAPFDHPSQIHEQHQFGAALEKALGKEGAQQLLAEEMKCLEGFEQREFRRRPDLSLR